MGIAKRAKAIKPSPTLATAAKAKAMKAQGIDVVDFGVGEPDFDTPENVKQAGIKAIQSGFTKYTPAGGTDELKDAVIEKFKKDNGLAYERSQVLISCGAKHSLYNIAEALFDPGDEVIIPAPYWVSYPDQVLLNDATPVIVETTEQEGFTLTAAKLEKAVTKKTKALVLNSPSNPTGLAYDKKTLEEIAAVAVKHRIYVISDEIYEKLLYDGFKHFSIASLGTGDQGPHHRGERRFQVPCHDRLAHRLCGRPQGCDLRHGQHPEPEHLESCVHLPESGCRGASRSPGFHRDHERRIRQTKKIHGGAPEQDEGHFLPHAGRRLLCLPRVSQLFGKSVNGKTIKNSSDLAAYLLEDAKVALVSGDAFGADAYIRLSYATSMENIQKGLDRIEKAFARLQ